MVQSSGSKTAFQRVSLRLPQIETAHYAIVYSCYILAFACLLNALIKLIVTTLVSEK